MKHRTITRYCEKQTKRTYGRMERCQQATYNTHWNQLGDPEVQQLLETFRITGAT
jgi:hypothetical protein